MSTRSKRPELVLSEEEKQKLLTISRSKKLPKREVQRASILLCYSEGNTIVSIQRKLNVSRPTIYKCIDKALAKGVEAGLKDAYHGTESVISDGAKAWVINVACTKPTEHGLAAEVWSYSALARYIRDNAIEKGYESLSKASKATVWRILNKAKIKPHKIRYYLERRDEEFERKMREVLMVYQEVNIWNEHSEDTGQRPDVITVSVDEKPGIQAIANVAPDLPPVPGEHGEIGRDYEYKRLGTVSLLAALDMHDGRIIAKVRDRHRSREFIELLKELDEYYPKKNTIRLVLDNHSSHVSKETMRYLGTRPGRFIYVHTPKHGSWLNLVETAFSKMARSFLRHIRVTSKAELKERILKGIEEINADPVVHRWNKFDLETA